jgi:hypothetical protein
MLSHIVLTTPASDLPNILTETSISLMTESSQVILL